MNSPGIIVRIAFVWLTLGLVACGGGGYGGDDTTAAGTQPPVNPPASGIGTSGGTVLGPNGSKVEIPAGALAVITSIAVADAI